MTIWQHIKKFFLREKPVPESVLETKLPNNRIALVDEKGNFKGFK